MDGREPPEMATRTLPLSRMALDEMSATRFATLRPIVDLDGKTWTVAGTTIAEEDMEERSKLVERTNPTIARKV